MRHKRDQLTPIYDSTQIEWEISVDNKNPNPYDGNTTRWRLEITTTRRRVWTMMTTSYLAAWLQLWYDRMRTLWFLLFHVSCFYEWKLRLSFSPQMERICIRHNHTNLASRRSIISKSINVTCEIWYQTPLRNASIWETFSTDTPNLLPFGYGDHSFVSSHALL